MATATRTRPTSIEQVRTQALASWREWAHALASGGALPPTSELLEAAGLLGKSVDDLERDAAYIRAVHDEEAIRDSWKDRLDAVEAERGDLEEIDAAILQLEADLEAMRQRRGWGGLEGYSWGAARSKVDRLRKQRPDLFEGEA